MAGFSDPVFGGQTLIRYAARSPNFVAGQSGWSLFRTGDAEFNQGRFRGAVLIGNPNPGPGAVSIGLTGSAIPAVLTGFNAEYDQWYEVDIHWFNATEFAFQALVHNSFFALNEVITGVYTVANGVQLQTFQDGPTGGANTFHHGTDRYDTVRLTEDWRNADVTMTSTATLTMATPANFKMGAWVDYSNNVSGPGTGMQITGTTTNPTLGNSHLFSFYQFLNDKTLVLEWKLLVGGTWASGSGVYALSLPFAAKLDADGDAESLGQFRINDSGVGEKTGVMDIVSATTMQGLLSAGSRVASSTQTWNNPDSWRGSIIYQLA